MGRLSTPGIILAVCLAGLSPGVVRGQESPLVTVPLDVSGRRAVIEVSIDGNGPFPFVVDTEFSGVRIDPELIEELGLTKKDDARRHSISGFKATLAIGDLEFQQVSVSSWDEPDLGMGGDEPRGRLGLSVFSGYLVTVDFPGRSFQLQKGVLESGDGVLEYSIGKSPLNNDADVPFIPVLISGTPIDLAILTGIFGELLLPGTMTDHFPLSEEPAPVGRVATKKGESDVLGASLNGTLEIAGHQIGSPGIFFSDLVLNPGAAAEVFFEYALTFDQKSQRVRLLRDEGAMDHLNEEAVLVQNLTLQNINLREAFNRDKGKVRMLLILSPT